MDDQPTICQIQYLQQIAEPASVVDRPGHIQRRLKRFIRRRIAYLYQTFAILRNASEVGDQAAAVYDVVLQPGDHVRVRSRNEIAKSLNRWNCLRGCCFMEEMGSFCNTEQTVYKRVERFLDERDYHVKRCIGLVILKDVQCSGTVDFGRCDRSCFFFWREEWLEKIG